MRTAQLRFRGDVRAGEFREMLRGFKHHGCSLLVTGEVPGPVADRATRRLLGSPAEERTRLLALVDPGVDDVEALLPGGVPPDDPSVHVVGRRHGSRSGFHADAGPTATVPGPDPGSLRTTLCRAVERLDAERGGFAPAELRLSVVSLRALLDRHAPGAVAGFVRAVGDAVHGVDGMAHCRLGLPDGSAAVGALDPQFDARIELRQRDGLAPEQRWHVPGHGTTTWVTV